jgi:hypothetical protein
MKKLILMSALVMGGLGIKTADAQFGIRINLHLGTHPVYAPAPVVEEPVYDDDDYYYLPEVEAYYSVSEHSYYYQDGDRWISAAFLPGRYRDYDWRNAKRFEIHANRPFMHHDVYRGKFGGYGNRNDYYARAYPGRDLNYNDRGREQYDNRDNRGGQNNQNRGGFDRRDDRNQNGYNQAPDRNQGGQQQSSGRNQGGYNQPGQGQNQGGQQQNPSRNQGGNNGNSQPAQGQQEQGGNNSQPANHTGGRDRGSFTGNDHFAQNKMGVVQDNRQDIGRPVRN